MYSLLCVIGFAERLDAAAREAERARLDRVTTALPNVLSRLSAPTLPHVYNGGDHLVRLGFADAQACRAALEAPAWDEAAALLADASRVAHVERVAYGEGLSGGVADAPGVYRVALFAATRAPTPERLAEFADETAAMPRHIRSIQGWRVSPVETAEGSGPWTHVWEQEYRDLQGLHGAYMRHPSHWARVERWFDPEFPEHLVDLHLVHTFCALDASVLLPGTGR